MKYWGISIHWSVLALVAALFVLNACQSDTPAAKTGGGDAEMAGATDGGDVASVPDPGAEKAAQQRRAQELIGQIAGFKESLGALQQTVDAIPTVNKQKALDYEDLQARLEGYQEKSTYLEDEVKQILADLEGQPSNAAGGEGSVMETGPDITNRLYEQESGLAELKDALAVMSNAVERLKNSKGKQVVLFEEGK